MNKPIVIGVVGFIGSGKDTVADCLVQQHNFKRISFAGALKDAVSAVFGWDRELLEGKTVDSRAWREEVDSWWSNRLGIPHLSPRWVLQFWGTEVLRQSFHDDIWIASIDNKLKNSLDNIVISDCRFPNEIKSIKQAGGIVVRVIRGPNPDWYNDALIANSDSVTESTKEEALAKLKKNNIHPSEYSWVGLKFDQIIDNNGLISQLYTQVNDLVQSLPDSKEDRA